MNDTQRKRYFKAIGLTATAIGRAEEVIRTILAFIPLNEFDVFVDDALTDGKREYKSLYVIASSYLVEAKSFMTDMSFAAMNRDIVWTYTELSYHEYTPGSWADNSQVAFYIYTTDVFGLEVTATGNNCEYLYKLIKAHFRSGSGRGLFGAGLPLNPK